MTGIALGLVVIAGCARGESLQLAPPLRKHQGAVTYLVFSHDGKLLISADDECWVILWDVSNPAALAQLNLTRAQLRRNLQDGLFTNHPGVFVITAKAKRPAWYSSHTSRASALLWPTSSNSWHPLLCELASLGPRQLQYQSERRMWLLGKMCQGF